MKKTLLLTTLLLLTSAAAFAQSREKFVLTIKYLYATGGQAANDSICKLEEGEHYCIISPEIEGFIPDMTKVEGDMPGYDVTDTVTYSPQQCRLTTNSEPVDGGTTTGNGIFNFGQEVTVNASANQGFVFANWKIGEEQVSTQASHSFTITGDVVLTACFTAQSAETYTISASADPAEGGTVSGAGTFDEGATCTLNATANEGYSFVNWTEDGTQVSTESCYQFTVDANRTMVAHFEQQAPASHMVSIDPLIVHGMVTVSPEGEVEVGTQVTITATPDEHYSLVSLSAFNKDDASQTVEINDCNFVMPDFDVMVSASFLLDLPIIDSEIENPAAICAGEALELTAPTVVNADDVAWQMSPDDTFINPIIYEGQTLDGTYNGWKLRLTASNASGEVYSNVVSIAVNDLSGLTLSGESFICSGQESQYEIVESGNFDIEWSTTDANAIITENGHKATIKWGTAGNMTLSVLIEDPETGCNAELEMTVKVQSYINNTDIQNIVAKKQNGKPYLLIYPNPKDDYKYQWYKDGEAIEGADGQYYYPADGLEAGEYQVYISYNADAQGNLFCGAFCPVFVVDNADFAVFPNPASANGQIIVLSDNDGEAALAIYNMEGQLVHQQMCRGYETKINVQLPQGIYVIHYTANNIEKVQRIIVK